MRSALTGISVILFALTIAAAGQRPAARITQAIDAGQRVALAGSISPRALRASDEGLVAGDRPIRLVLHLGPTAAQQAALDALLEAQQDANSPEYHRWLTPEQFGERFGAAPEDVAKIAAWLEQNQFQVTDVARAHNTITATGPAAAVEATLGVALHRVAVAGEEHYANLDAPTVPAALAGIVTSISGLNDFRPHAQARRLASPAPSASLSPQALASAYDLAPLAQQGMIGTGQTLVVVGQSQILSSDLTQFRSQFGLTGSNPTVTFAGGTDPGQTSDMVEADLDLEWSEAVAPAATTQYVYAQNVFNAVEFAIANRLGSVISISFGACEADNSAASQTSFQLDVQQANAQGMTVLASSGDTGAANCESQTSKVATTGLAVSFPATIPEVTGVGGTAFTTAAQAGSGYPGESVWNDTALGGGLSASGGGVSTIFAEPTWQKGIPGVPASPAFRFVPDVAFSASPNQDPYVIVSGGKTIFVGGTSASTPVFAGGLILLNEYLQSKGALTTPGLGNINQKLYSLSQSNPTAFHDITSGDNKVPCTIGSTGCTASPIGFAATAGYDEVTGLGSLDFNQFFLAWAGAAPKVPLSLSVGTLDFGSQVVNTPSTAQTVTVTNNMTSAISFTNIAVAGDFAATNNCGASLAAQASCAVTVTFTPTVTGARSGVLTLTDSATTSPQTVALSGTGLSSTPTATLSANTLAYGTQMVGTSETKAVTLSNSGGVALQFTSMVFSPGYAADSSSTCGSQVAAGASCSLAVDFKPTATGSQNGTVTISDNAPNSPQTVTLSGTGGDFTVAPIASGSATATVTAGQGTTYSLVITPVSGLTAVVSLSCTGAPSAATCIPTPPSATVSGAPVNFSVIVATTARGAAIPWLLMFLGGLGLLLLALTAQPRRRPRWHRLWVAGAAAAVLMLAGCGGGGGGGGGMTTPTAPTGTPAGTYPMTLTASVTSNGTTVQHTLPLTLVVQ